MKANVLLLEDVVETFQNTCLEQYKLNLAHFYAAPRLAWQVLLDTGSEYCEHETNRKDCELCLDKFLV